MASPAPKRSKPTAAHDRSKPLPRSTRLKAALDAEDVEIAIAYVYENTVHGSRREFKMYNHLVWNGSRVDSAGHEWDVDHARARCSDADNELLCALQPPMDTIAAIRAVAACPRHLKARWTAAQSCVGHDTRNDVLPDWRAMFLAGCDGDIDDDATADGLKALRLAIRLGLRFHVNGDADRKGETPRIFIDHVYNFAWNRRAVGQLDHVLVGKLLELVTLSLRLSNCSRAAPICSTVGVVECAPRIIIGLRYVDNARATREFERFLVDIGVTRKARTAINKRIFSYYLRSNRLAEARECFLGTVPPGCAVTPLRLTTGKLTGPDARAVIRHVAYDTLAEIKSGEDTDEHERTRKVVALLCQLDGPLYWPEERGRPHAPAGGAEV